MKEKICLFCNSIFIPTGKNQKYCSKEHQHKHSVDKGLWKEYRDRFNAKQGVWVGIGSGNRTGVGIKNPRYTNGRHAFRNFARKLKVLGVPCNHCGKDLREATKGEWLGHHKDHDPSNNDLNNLVLLCKACHHFHHETYRNLPTLKKVQRLSRKGVENSILEAQSILIKDDDIV